MYTLWLDPRSAIAGGSSEFRHYPKKRFVVLKSLNDSQNITTDFLQEIANHKLVESEEIVSCFGISQDPQTKNYLMVMDYMKDGNLRQYLQNNQSQEDNHAEDNDNNLDICGGTRKHIFRQHLPQQYLPQKNRLELNNKIKQLSRIARGLRQIHDQGLMHRDLHSGNILAGYAGLYITDLGLCRPVNETSQEKIFGVMPYVAPEVLNNKPYTQKADIYSFGIVAYEVLSGLPPYYDREHNARLGLAICNGLRPQFQIKIPQLLKGLIKRCWDNDSTKRPTANELEKTLRRWEKDRYGKFQNQLQEAEEYNQTLPDSVKYPDYKKNLHSEAVYTSRLLPTKEITDSLSTYMSSGLDNLDINELSDKFNIQKNDQDTSTGLTKDLKRQLSFSVESQGKPKSVKLDIKEQTYQTEPMEIDETRNWQNIHLEFAERLRQNWQELGFNYSQTQDWINIGLKPTDYNLANFLKSQKNLTPEQTLNNHNLESLKAEFQAFEQNQQTTQTIQSTTPPFNPNN